MTTYVQLAQALVATGYLTDADVEAAAIVLTDALRIEEAKIEQDFALEDEAAQQEQIAGLKIAASTDSAIGDYVGAQVEQDRIEKARAEEEKDEAIIEETSAMIASAYDDAAAALLAAELIDEASLEAVASVIADAWIMEEE
jgi:hypothetical protein